MAVDSPRDRREGLEGSSAPAARTVGGTPRQRFRTFLEHRIGGVPEAAWYLEQVMPRLGADPEARVAAEELLDHVGRLMRFDACRTGGADVSVWTSRQGVRIAVALVDPFDAAGGISRAGRATEALRVQSTSTWDSPDGLLCVVAGDVRPRPIERLLEVRRLTRWVKVVAIRSVVSLAGAVESGVVSPELAAAALEPGVLADPLVVLLSDPSSRPGIVGS